ncbi:MAG: DMT family transporter [Lachnospiraceae bacterium]|nr:DMT family transporter [Lachnospiraceae bacterium]
MKMTNLKKSFALFLAAVIWGMAFVAQSEGSKYLGPFTFNSVRFLLGTVTLIPVIFVSEIIKKRRPSTDASFAAEPTTSKTMGTKTEVKEEFLNKETLIGGILCGVVLSMANGTQQIGLEFTTPGKAGFITACYIILVPIFGIFLKRKCNFLVWLSVVLSVCGLALLCLTEELTIGKGDLIVFVCAILFAIHILVIDHFGENADSVKMSCIQFGVAGIVSAILMLIFENPDMTYICKAWLPLVYTGVCSSGIAFTLQIIGQKDMNPTVASIIMSLESVVSVVAGFIILHQKLSARELWGCMVMFVAIILVQLPVKQKER